MASLDVAKFIIIGNIIEEMFNQNIPKSNKIIKFIVDLQEKGLVGNDDLKHGSILNKELSWGLLTLITI